MAVDRALPTPEAHDLLDLVRDLIAKEVAPRAAGDEAEGRFPREVFATLGRSGLLGLPYPEEYGGAAQPQEVYLQVVEELAAAFLAVGLGLSVHTLSCFPVASYAREEVRAALLPGMLGGELLGAYCLSEPQSGSDAAALATRAGRAPEGGYELNGVKAWTTHGGAADFYTLMARTSDGGARGISCFHVPATAPGLSFGRPERKMGMRSSPTAQVRLDGVRLGEDALIGAEGEGFRIAMAALDGGRLGIAACAVGVAQAALDAASSYARERRQFGSRIADFQGVGFMLADMATQVAAARSLYLDAARLRDAGRPYGPRAAMAKLFATDAAMKVTTDAVQIFGGYGYVEDFPVERYMREAKVLQIVEGTNQIQRLVISRALGKGEPV
ncbi:acyl-CoA dehydrogenase [Sphaerisporangium siamense]|uniref:Alkylation response protein AidB-like acyl-CoA dehydrogenase n=1 Tax=Sphaerisporangium siamense TaxID=795645 RepID=A0A7W7DB42_9ACTN|nr:acyl-CoA dehydrogenase family protein [Sphaerisporangium siamense]MBB4703589.1 alkylation response protein AidB-like acyl-CoA dehydrogenase [Sphaerisporangium siamense]GII82060.1 acyl-CoA dehydrogenase [Sphaerisporangium siamense]